MSKDKETKKKKKSKKNKKAIIAVVILIILILGIGGAWAWAEFTPGYIFEKDAVENYFKAVGTEDRGLYKDTCYPGKWQDFYSESGTDINTEIDEAFKYQSGATYSDVNIVSDELLDEEYVERMKSSIQFRFYSELDISKIARVNFTINTIYDGESSTSETITRYCYKTGGKWYFLGNPYVLVDLGIDE